MPKPFRDRHDAGHRLAKRLTHLRGEDALVLALPRGGVPVGAEVSSMLGWPLDVVVVRRLTAPADPSLTIGALGPGGAFVLDRDLMQRARLDADGLRRLVDHERQELARRQRLYRQDRLALSMTGRMVVLVDDGIVTGASARAALEVLPHLGPHRIVLAVPVVPASVAASLRRDVDELVFVHAPKESGPLDQWYEDFTPLTDEDVLRELQSVRSATA